MITLFVALLHLSWAISSTVLLLNVSSGSILPGDSAYTHQDGVDYIPMPTWKVFMIQFLNIAGLGPIFGAIMGAKFGTASFLWIVLGSIFGSHHDYLAECFPCGIMERACLRLSAVTWA